MSQLLVDTHAVLWWLADDAALSARAHELIADPRSVPLVSAASLWEIAIKRSLGKLEAPDDLLDVIAANGFVQLPVTADHAWAIQTLAFHHRDPFDRLLVAQAQRERVAIVSADRRLAAYDVEVEW